MLSIIPLPSNFISSITANTGDIFTDLAPYVALIVGVLLGVVVIQAIISTIKK
jgi:hypothetical protein